MLRYAMLCSCNQDISVNIASEVEFSFPPAFTVYMTAAVHHGSCYAMLC
jgi:hypothetical protein